jgi:hypothetical protein
MTISIAGSGLGFNSLRISTAGSAGMFHLGVDLVEQTAFWKVTVMGIWRLVLWSFFFVV